MRGTKTNFRTSLSCSFLKRSIQTNISKTLVRIIKRGNFTPTWGSVKLISTLWVLPGTTRTSSTFEWAPLIPVFPAHLNETGILLWKRSECSSNSARKNIKRKKISFKTSSRLHLIFSKWALWNRTARFPLPIFWYTS